jgi:hypothetical protein
MRLAEPLTGSGCSATERPAGCKLACTIYEADIVVTVSYDCQAARRALGVGSEMELEAQGARPCEEMLVAPFTSPRAVRTRTVGLDIWLEAHRRVGDSISGALTAALCGTHARLEQLEDAAGRRLWPRAVGTESSGSAGDAHSVSPVQVRCRVMARSAGAHLSSEALGEVLAALSRVGNWTVVRRLDESDGRPAFGRLGAIEILPPTRGGTR